VNLRGFMMGKGMRGELGVEGKEDPLRPTGTSPTSVGEAVRESAVGVISDRIAAWIKLNLFQLEGLCDEDTGWR